MAMETTMTLAMSITSAPTQRCRFSVFWCVMMILILTLNTSLAFFVINFFF